MKNFDKIDKYLKGEMGVEEERVFEKAIEVNEELAVEVELQKQENLALRNLAFNLLKKNIKSLDLNNADDISEDKANANKSIEKQNKGTRLFMLLLAIIGLIIIGMLIQNWSGKNTEKKAKAKPFEKVDKIPPTENIAKDTVIAIEAKKEPSTKIIRSKEKRNIREKIKETPKKTIDHKAIAAANFIKKINTRGQESFVSTESSEWNTINELITQNKLNEAIDSINILTEKNDYYLDARLLRAQIHLRTNRFSEATIDYQYLLKEGDEFIKDTYQYELLLSLLGQLPQTSVIFKETFKALEDDPDFTYQEEMAKIKADLIAVNFNFE
jgi:tetratricopeptide (TPR) repeat protein